MKNLKKLEETVIYDLRELYHRYGYAQFKMSKFEAYDLYMQNKEFLVSNGVITFTDTDGTLMALKPDVTLSIVKNFRKENTPTSKVCYNENVYRIAGASRSYREIMQTGLECLGDVGLYEIGEVLCLAIKSLRTISDRSVMEISHMGIVAEVLSSLALTEKETADALKCLADKNKDALCAAIGAQRAASICQLMDVTGRIETALPCLEEIVSGEAVAQLRVLFEIFKRSGLSDCVNLDFSIISDGKYYNDIVFRGYVEGIPTAILAGGQYDRLMEKMNKQAKGIGFAVYLDQLELLEQPQNAYDIDTLILYDDHTDPALLSQFADEYAPQGVLLAKTAPTRTTWRQMLKVENGRLVSL